MLKATLPFLLWDGLTPFVRTGDFFVDWFFAHFAWYYATCSRTSMRFGHDSCRPTLDVS